MKYLSAAIASFALSLIWCGSASAQRDFKPLKLEGFLLKWGAPELGTPAHITYAFVVAPIRSEKARNCRQMEGFARLAANTGLTEADIRSEAVRAFEIWSSAVDISFEQVASPEEADIVVGAQTRPRGFAFTNVRYASGRDQGGPNNETRALSFTHRSGSSSAERTGDRIAVLEKSAICLNPTHRWKIGFDGDLKAYDLKYTFAHEIGHAIGLDHFLAKPSIMHFKYKELFDGLQPSDVEGGRWLYGAPSAR